MVWLLCGSAAIPCLLRQGFSGLIVPDTFTATILLSSLVGAIVGSIWLASQGRDRATPIAFGPYLAVAGWVAFFWGEQMVDAYLRFSGLR